MDRLHGVVASPVAAFPAGLDARVAALLASTGAYGFWWYDVQQVEGAV
jgi:hypothetical protein